ncbi:MAG: hypothetical protein ACRENL_06005 [Candidatus Dormibacteria bacterium]
MIVTTERMGRVVEVDGSGCFNRPGPRIVHGPESRAAGAPSSPGSAPPRGAVWLLPAQRAALA